MRSAFATADTVQLLEQLCQHYNGQTFLSRLRAGPMLGQRNINIANFVREFNERTATMKKGIPLPVRCKATSDKTFDLDIHMPPTTFFIKQAAGLSVGTIKGELAGYITLKHVYEIAKIKLADPPNALKTHQDMCKQVITTAKTCGVKVVRHLDPVEYGKHLQERKQFVQADRAAKQAERESKMLRASE